MYQTACLDVLGVVGGRGQHKGVCVSILGDSEKLLQGNKFESGDFLYLELSLFHSSSLEESSSLPSKSLS